MLHRLLLGLAVVVGCFTALEVKATESLIRNGGFEQIGSDGKPTGWHCYCSLGATDQCSVATGQAHSGRNSIVIPPYCKVVTSFSYGNPGRGLYIRFVLQGGLPKSADAVVRTWGYGATQRSHFQKVSGRPDWQTFQSEVLSSSEIQGRGTFELENTSPANYHLDDVVGSDDAQEPPAKVASVLKNAHHTVVEYRSRNASASLWIPLPLDYASQVPLSVDLAVTPREDLQSLTYEQDPFGNWGAIVRLRRTTSKTAAIHWEGVVLVKRLAEAEYPEYYKPTHDPGIWMAATRAADAQQRDISTLVANLRGQSDSETLMKILEWLPKNIEYGVDFAGLDATNVFKVRKASCTGFANLATAMGRAGQVPSRSLAGYLVGMAQQTHSINEFYLRPQVGWFRAEPQMAYPVEEDYVVSTRIITPEDEGSVAFDIGRPAILGVPFRSVVEVLDGRQDISLPQEKYFPGNPSADNKAEHLADLRGDVDQMNGAFGAARTAWHGDLAKYLNGSISRDRLALRRSAESIRTFTDLNAFLGTLKYGPTVSSDSQAPLPN